MKAIVRCPGPNGMGLSTGHHATADEMNVEETDLDSHFPNIYRLSQDPIFDSYICNGNILVFHEINLPDGDRRSEVEGGRSTENPNTGQIVMVNARYCEGDVETNVEKSGG